MSSESIANILKALYESSSTIKVYVDTVLKGEAVPYTILFKSADMDRNEKIVEKLKTYVGECDCEYGGCIHSVAEELLKKK